MLTIPNAVIAARSRLGASANTRFGLLPPSSSETRVIRSALADTIREPTTRLPVNEILSMPGWVISASPVGSPGPSTRLKTPGGTPASSSSAVSRIAVRLANSLGFSTIVQPAASAGATL